MRAADGRAIQYSIYIAPKDRMTLSLATAHERGGIFHGDYQCADTEDGDAILETLNEFADAEGDGPEQVTAIIVQVERPRDVYNRTDNTIIDAALAFAANGCAITRVMLATVHDRGNARKMMARDRQLFKIGADRRETVIQDDVTLSRVAHPDADLATLAHLQAALTEHVRRRGFKTENDEAIGALLTVLRKPIERRCGVQRLALELEVEQGIARALARFTLAEIALRREHGDGCDEDAEAEWLALEVIAEIEADRAELAKLEASHAA